jgi:hypothetical protein
VVVNVGVMVTVMVDVGVVVGEYVIGAAEMVLV